MPVRFRTLSNFSDTISNLKDKHVVRYNNTSGRFELVSVDDVLEFSQEDDDISNPFVTQLEQQIDADNIPRESVDGGSF
tara:strand:+ start:1715 stop:1951 length:237 start_codon:yes stop_codon:yes gene_type:complete